MKWTIEDVTALGTSYWRSAAVSAAVQLGVFELLDQPADAADIASRINASPRHVSELLDALAGMGLLRKDGDRYSVDPGAAPYLSRKSPSCLLDALRFNIDLFPLWGRLHECVKTGKPVMPPHAHLGHDPEQTRRFVMGMHSRALMMAPTILPSIDLRRCSSLLDVGAGPGTFSRMLAEKHAGLKVTLFDLPPILNVARELSAQSQVSSRISYHPGDYRADPLPRGFDAILYCGALHQETPESAAGLMKKVAASLNPGGTVFVVDMMLDETKTQPVFSALFSLNMALMSPQGRVFSDKEIGDILSSSGFSSVQTAKPDNGPYWIVSGTKRVA